MQILWFKCDQIIGGTALAVGFIAVCLGGFFLQYELADDPGTERHCAMASESASNMDKFKSEGHSAFVLGYTGESGKALVKDLSQLQVFKKVVLVGRREVALDATLGPQFVQKVVDFENLEASKDVFEGLDVGFCCLGTTRSKAGASGFVRVDHDYVLNTASVAKDQGCKHFTLVSSMGADKNSSLLYPRTKGQVEEALKVMHFDRVSVYRPAVLMCDRQENRPGEAIARFLLKPVSYLFPTAITTPVEILARAMINNAASLGEKFELYENKAIHQQAGNKCDKKEEKVGDGHQQQQETAKVK